MGMFKGDKCPGATNVLPNVGLAVAPEENPRTFLGKLQLERETLNAHTELHEKALRHGPPLPTLLPALRLALGRPKCRIQRQTDPRA
jgi:hypothetical protein